MKKPEDCTVEELLCDVQHWEGPEHLCLQREEDGSVVLSDFEMTHSFTGKTMKEALILFGRHWKNRFERFDDEELGEIDWSIPVGYECQCMDRAGQRTCTAGNFEG